MKETTKFVGIEADYGDDYKWPNLEELIDACFLCRWILKELKYRKHKTPDGRHGQLRNVLFI